MDEYLLPSFLFVVLFFCGSAAFLHVLITGYRSGVVEVRGGAFYRKRTGLRNASDFWFIMAFYAFIGLFCFLAFGFLWAFLSSSTLGLALNLFGIVVNAGISLRRPPEKKTLSNTAFSVMSILGASILVLVVIFNLVHKLHDFPLSLLALLGSVLLIVIHSIRLKSGKFVTKYRKPGF